MPVLYSGSSIMLIPSLWPTACRCGRGDASMIRADMTSACACTKSQQNDCRDNAITVLLYAWNLQMLLLLLHRVLQMVTMMFQRLWCLEFASIRRLGRQPYAWVLVVCCKLTACGWGHTIPRNRLCCSSCCASTGVCQPAASVFPGTGVYT
jgi:hypothetical protein